MKLEDFLSLDNAFRGGKERTASSVAKGLDAA
jgi:hypothetical protein